MEKEKIILKEKANDGQTVNLYYDRMAGVYLAYGISAFYTTLITEPYLSYSEEMELPVALLRRVHILFLRQSLHLENHEKKVFYQFKLKSFVGNAGYDKWCQKIVENNR